MALFPRRIVQRELDLLRRNVLKPGQDKGIVGQLNSASRQALSIEWEVMLLGAFARHSRVEYEPQIGRRFPDLRLTHHKDGANLEFVADIVAVSDLGTKDKNAVDFLYERILMLAIKIGVDFANLGWHVGDGMMGRYPNRHVTVMLPAKGEIQRRLNSSVKPFLHRVKAEPMVKHELVWNDPGIDFRLNYDPARRRADFGGPLLATAAYSLTENPLYERLDEKAHALRQTNYNGIRGIIAVDGDCQSIRSPPYGGGGSYDARQIVTEFLAHHPAISFVTTTYCECTGFIDRGYHLYHYIHFQRRLDQRRAQHLESLIRGALSELPQPRQSPGNAIRDVIERREVERGCNLGAYGLTGSRKLSVPVRVFLALLTRTITDRDFTLLLSERSAPEGGYLNNFFRTLAMNNLPLGRVSIRRCENEDDDWITFEVGSSKASVPEPLGASPADTCEIPVSVIVNDLATLDGCQPTTGTRKPLARKISKNECEFILAMLAQARLLDLAELINEGRTLRLTFGRKDAAIGPYF